MNYYIKQQVFSIGEKFTIRDKEGNPVFYAEGQFFSIPKEFNLYDLKGKEILRIEEEFFTLLPKFYLYIGDKQVAIVKKNFTLFDSNYSVEGLNWDIEGNFWGHEYEILEDSRLLADISKEYFSWGDTYEISIYDEDYTDVLLGIVISIDAALAKENN